MLGKLQDQPRPSKWTEVGAHCALILLLLVLFGAMTSYVVTHGIGAIQWHVDLAEKMLENHRLYTPHPLYQLLNIAIHLLIPRIDYDTGSIIAGILIYIVTGEVIYLLMGHLFDTSLAWKGAIARILLSVALILVIPIAIFAVVDGRFYFGYIAINTYVDPTTLIAKPTSILLFWYATRAFIPQTRTSNPLLSTLGIGLLSIIAALAKPSFSICLLPAFGLWTLGAMLHKRPINWWIVVGGIGLPTVLALGWQYAFTYTRTSLDGVTPYSNGIGFEPFRVYNYYSAPVWHLPKFLLSILFPLSVAVMYRTAAYRDTRIGLAWLTFLFGAFYTYFIVEDGPVMMSGNFLWSGQLSLFVLFIFSAIFVVQQEEYRFAHSDRAWFGNTRFVVCATIFMLHVLFGIYWYCGVLFYGFGSK